MRRIAVEGACCNFGFGLGMEHGPGIQTFGAGADLRGLRSIGVADCEQEGWAGRQMAFDHMLSSLMSGFASAAVEDVEAAVRAALREVAELSGVEHACLAMESDGQQTIDTLDGDPAELPAKHRSQRPAKDGSILRVPLDGPAGTRAGFIGLHYVEACDLPWLDGDIERLRMIGNALVTALRCARAERALQAAHSAIEELKNRLPAEIAPLPIESKAERIHGSIIGQSAAIKKVLLETEQVAKTRSTVLLLGETGVGKELIAQAIHELSPCAGRAMVKVNCAGLPSTLVESELFGREKGAYTGALTRQAGRFELADGSTILLDEIGEVPLELQAKLLRVLQDGRFERLGSVKTINSNVRVVAATNRDLAAAVRKGTFREDLYYRLAVFPITVPPLRERAEDIPALVWSFVKEFERNGRPRIASIPNRTMESLQRYTWPGNIRELRNVIEHAMIISSGPVLRVELPKSPEVTATPTGTLEEVERTYILRVLEQAGWHVGGNAGAAARLGLKPTTLRSKMERLGIQRLKSNGGS